MAIVNRKAQALINGKTWVLNTQKKEAGGRDADKLRKLWAQPNPLQNNKQFEAQGYIYQQLFGFNIILPIRPLGFDDPLDTTSMWNIPASWIDWNATLELFTRNGGISLKEIVVTFNNARTIFQLKDLLIVRDFTPSFDTITFPGSKIISMTLPINNIIGAFESRNVLINYRGALGILSSDPGKGQFTALPLQKQEKEDLQRDFRRYGLRNRQFQVILTSASLKWQSMGYPTKDLLLMEEVQESTKSLCDGLNFPPHLLGLIDPTFNNQASAEKGLYQNSIIPDAENIYEYWNNFFKLKERNLLLDKDYAHIPALQEDKKFEAEARRLRNEALEIEFRNNVIHLNRWRELNGEDTVPGEDLYYYQLSERGKPEPTTEEQVILANSNGKSKVALPLN